MLKYIFFGGLRCPEALLLAIQDRHEMSFAKAGNRVEPNLI